LEQNVTVSDEVFISLVMLKCFVMFKKNWPGFPASPDDYHNN